MWVAHELSDKAQILSFLETDRLYAAYAIGDLEPDLFVQSRWAGVERAGQLRALALHFYGLSPPALFLMGDVDELRVILEGVLFPRRVYLTCREEHLAMIQGFYVWDRKVPMWRMVLPPGSFHAVGGDCVRLSISHADQLAALYALGGGGAFNPAQMGEGVFYGVFTDGQLVAAAGTHLVSPTYRVAAVGNIFVHPDHRGRGHGTVTTSAVVTELLERGICDIVLNVAQDNHLAVHVYEKLGFERYCPFLEGRAVRGVQ